MTETDFADTLADPAWILPENPGDPASPNAAARAAFPGFAGCRAAEIEARLAPRAAQLLSVILDGRRRQVLVALPDRESRARLALRASGHVMFDWHLPSGRLDWSAAPENAFGYDTASFPGTLGPWLDRIHPDDRDRMVRTIHGPLDPGREIWEEAYRFLRADGTTAHVIDRGYLLRDAQGLPERMVGAMLDVSAIHEAEARFQLATSASSDVLFLQDLETDTCWWSDALQKQYGLTPEPGPGSMGWWLSHIHPDDRDRVAAELGAAHESSTEIWAGEYRFARADGSYARVIDRARFLRDASGKAIRSVGSMVDVSVLLEGEERFRLAAEAAQDVIYTWSPDTAETWRSAGYAQTFGLDPAAPARGPGSWHSAIHPEDRTRIDRMRDTALARRDDRWECSYRVIRGDGRIAHVIDRALAQRRPDGRLHRIIGSVVDVTRLREEEERLHALLRVASDVVYDIDLRSDALVLSDSAAEVLGPGWLGPQVAFGIWRERLHHDDRARMVRDFRGFVAGRGDEWRSEYRLLRQDGQVIHIRDRALALRDEEGRAFRVIGTLEDITAEAEAALKLSQSQRLEALGKLTGGVAHDFNNLLSVILGNAELLAEADTAPEQRAMAEAVVRAASRGADLVRSLLAFARRQPLRPQVLDTGMLLDELRGMLERTLPAHIRLRITPGTGLWAVEADPAQLQTALLNLAVNAADAMRAGGDLLIEAENVRLDPDYVAANPGARAGAFLRLSISDTGQGMPPEVVARAFDPFFTTKEVGRGSGLGLSMVHGFASQSGGHVTLYSEPERGTTVRLYLPRSGQDAATTALLRARASSIRMGAGEHVIVAEDDPALRPHVARLLESLGYRVTAAEDGEAALAAIRAAPDARLLFSDVVMPGDLNGIALATRAVAERPGLKVLLTSGYTEQAIRSRAPQADRFAMLPKPYRRDELATRLREVLEDGVD